VKTKLRDSHENHVIKVEVNKKTGVWFEDSSDGNEVFIHRKDLKTLVQFLLNSIIDEEE